MATPSPALRAAFYDALSDDAVEGFLCWLADRDAAVKAISGSSLVDFANPGWVELWADEAGMDECLEDLASVDFKFEGLMMAWNGERVS